MLTGKQYQNNSYFIPVMSEMLLGSQEIAKIYVCQFFYPTGVLIEEEQERLRG